MQFLHQLWLQEDRWEAGQHVVVDSTGAYDFQELLEHTATITQWLQQLGVRPGGRVVIVADASFSSICLLAACSLAGAAFTVISPEVPGARPVVLLPV